VIEEGSNSTYNSLHLVVLAKNMLNKFFLPSTFRFPVFPLKYSSLGHSQNFATLVQNYPKRWAVIKAKGGLKYYIRGSIPVILVFQGFFKIDSELLPFLLSFDEGNICI